MKKIPAFTDFVLETSSGEIFNPKRNKPVRFDHKKYPDLAGEFFELIQTAYRELGGHAKIKSPDDVFRDPDWNWWEGVDLHGSQDFDLIMFGKKTKWGVKYTGVGHDGTSAAKRSYIKSRAKELKNTGFYVEASGKIADILIKDYNVPVVTDPKVVERVLGTQIDWIGQLPPNPGWGWYSRKIAGKNHNKILLGKPKSS